MDIIVRPARAEDQRFVDDLGTQSAGSSLSRVRPAPPDVAARAFKRLAKFCADRDGAITLVAELDDRLVGFCILLTDIPDEVTQEDQAFIVYMAVAVEARRRGVGRALVHAAEVEAGDRGLPHLSLMVTAENAAARALYESERFVDERVLMTKPLLSVS